MSQPLRLAAAVVQTDDLGPAEQRSPRLANYLRQPWHQVWEPNTFCDTSASSRHVITAWKGKKIIATTIAIAMNQNRHVRFGPTCVILDGGNVLTLRRVKPCKLSVGNKTGPIVFNINFLKKHQPPEKEIKKGRSISCRDVSISLNVKCFLFLTVYYRHQTETRFQQQYSRCREPQVWYICTFRKKKPWSPQLYEYQTRVRPQ